LKKIWKTEHWFFSVVCVGRLNFAHWNTSHWCEHCLSARSELNLVWSPSQTTLMWLVFCVNFQHTRERRTFGFNSVGQGTNDQTTREGIASGIAQYSSNPHENNYTLHLVVGQYAQNHKSPTNPSRVTLFLASLLGFSSAPLLWRSLILRVKLNKCVSRISITVQQNLGHILSLGFWLSDFIRWLSKPPNFFRYFLNNSFSAIFKTFFLSGCFFF